MFSIVVPMDANRLKQFRQTKLAYDAMPQKKEFIIVTRTKSKVIPYLIEHDLLKDVVILPYKIDTPGFNCSKALNLGVRHAKYGRIIITSPEVKPYPDVLDKLVAVKDEDVICQVFDQDENGNLTSLVCNGYRSDTPAMYFLALFQKKDIEAINGWDEDFMLGYAYEDNDFGDRWNRAGLPFIVRDDIKATHQFHPRSETIRGGLSINQAKYHANTDASVIQCKNGLKMLN